MGQWLTGWHSSSNGIPGLGWPPKSNVSKPHLSSFFTTPWATAVSSPHSLKPPEASSIAISVLTYLRPRGLIWFRVWFGGLCKSRPHNESLQPCIKSDVQLWLCRQLWKQILQVYCFTLSPQASPVSAVGREGDNSPECTLILWETHLLWAFRDLGAIEDHDIRETVKYIYLQRFQSSLGDQQSCSTGEVVTVAGGEERLVMTYWYS